MHEALVVVIALVHNDPLHLGNVVARLRDLVRAVLNAKILRVRAEDAVGRCQHPLFVDNGGATGVHSYTVTQRDHEGELGGICIGAVHHATTEGGGR